MTELSQAVPAVPSIEWSPERDARERALLEEIERLQKLLESAKVQYEELMGVALQYREEAAKWYERYIHGRRP